MPNFIPVHKWRALMRRELSHALPYQQLNFPIDLDRLPEIKVDRATLIRFIGNNSGDLRPLYAGLVGFFQAFFAHLFDSFTPMSLELDNAVCRHVFRLTGSIEGVVFVRTMHHDCKKRFGVRVIVLHKIEETGSLKKNGTTHRFVGFCPGVKHLTPIQLITESFFRHYYGEDRKEGWHQAILETRLLENILMLAEVAHDPPNYFDMVMAPLIHSNLTRCSPVNDFLNAVLREADLLNRVVRQTRQELTEFIQVLSDLRLRVHLLTNWRGKPRNMPSGLTRDDVFQLIVVASFAIYEMSFASEQFLLNKSYGIDGCDYTTLNYLPSFVDRLK